MLEEGARLRHLTHFEEIVRQANLAAAKLPQAFLDTLYESKSLHTVEAWISLAAVGASIETRGGK
jgi:hypothetical protein